MNLSKKQIEMIEPEDFKMSKEELYKVAFEVAGVTIDNIKNLTKEQAAIYLADQMRLHQVIAGLYAEMDIVSEPHWNN